MWERIKSYAPGVIGAVILGVIAKILNMYLGMPVMLAAVLLGLFASQLYEADKAGIKTGVNWTSSFILRTGVALLGLRVAFVDLRDLGWDVVGLIVLLVISTIMLGLLLARLFKLDSQFGALTGAAVAICGASATMAVSSVLPDHKNKEHFTVIAILGMALLSTCAMITYPLLAAFLGMDYQSSGVFLGAAIHDVAQVVGAGYSVSDQAGDTATLVKLLRVSALMPVLLGFALYFRFANKAEEGGTVKTGYRPPIFLVAFFILMTANSLLSLPEMLTGAASEVARYALICAIASIGMKSCPFKLKDVGVLPFFIMVLETVWMAAGACMIALWAVS